MKDRFPRCLQPPKLMRLPFRKKPKRRCFRKEGQALSTICLLLERPRPLLQFLIGASILVGTATASMHLLVPELDEMLTLGTVGRLVF